MKRSLFLAIMVVALSTAVFASSVHHTNSVDYTNIGGTLSGSKTGLTLSGSVLTAVDGLNQLITGSDLGSVAFQTGSLLSGSFQQGGTFAAGGSFTITGNGSSGVANGILFTGTFSAPATWTLVTLADGTHNYTLTGALKGTTGSGYSTVGVTVQLTINTGKGFFTGCTKIASGDTSIVVPEPSSLGLLGTGLIGLAGVIRFRRKA